MFGLGSQQLAVSLVHWKVLSEQRCLFTIWSSITIWIFSLFPTNENAEFQHRKSYPANGNFGVYGIDCEMCYTVAGLELTKVNNQAHHNLWKCVYKWTALKIDSWMLPWSWLLAGQVTVVGVDGRLVYESLVLPDNQVADYNTRFSGITKKDLGERWNSIHNERFGNISFSR